MQAASSAAPKQMQVRPTRCAGFQKSTPARSSPKNRHGTYPATTPGSRMVHRRLRSARKIARETGVSWLTNSRLLLLRALRHRHLADDLAVDGVLRERLVHLVPALLRPEHLEIGRRVPA